jgi:hypothetical protein
MYTGIVQAPVPVVRVEHKPGLQTYAVELPDALIAGSSPAPAYQARACARRWRGSTART